MLLFRELITIPHGGVAALPPSFLVNQLQDLMARWVTVLLLLTRMMLLLVFLQTPFLNTRQEITVVLPACLPALDFTLTTSSKYYERERRPPRHSLSVTASLCLGVT